MSLLDEVKAWPMPEQTETTQLVHGRYYPRMTGPVYSEEALRTARESVAAEADARMVRLCEALARIIRHTSATPGMSENGCGRLLALIEHEASAALSEARKA